MDKTHHTHVTDIPLCFRVGVTGHRDAALAAVDRAALEKVVAEVLAQLAQNANQVLQQQSAVYSGGAAQLQLISALAEGTDRLVAQQALQAGWTLHALLPFSAANYQLDFETDASKQAFSGLLDAVHAVTDLAIDRTTAQLTGYEAVGKLLARNTDVLIALWDGEPARGPGGTASVVEMALQEGVPVVWVGLTAELQVRCIAPGNGVVNQISWQSWLADFVENTLTPPQQDSDRLEQQELAQFMATSPGRVKKGWLYPFFQWCFTGRKPGKSDFVQAKQEDVCAQQWHAFNEGTSEAMPDVQASAAIHQHYIKADLLASMFAQQYRAASILNYVLASMAVLMALLGLLLKDLKLVWILLELSIILGMLGNTYIGKRHRWHQKWLDYRLLAEQLRVARYFALIGANSLKQHRWLSSFHQAQHVSWVNWYLTAVIRSVNLPAGQLGNACTERFSEGLTTQLNDQIAYHHHTAAQAHKAEHRLHILGEVCLYGTLLACLGYLGVAVFSETVNYSVATWVTFITALLPAFGASSYGLRAHGDYEGIAHRSELTATQLSDIAGRLEQTEHDLASLLTLSELVRQVKSAELRDWRVTFERKLLAIPG
ncbi:hypothetical protein [Shewanella ulleungensis]|uniref:SMODS and SLOG-associating 2TM effector domain-containing protein n=1 Tax=Shewanella ulleungensis TaxID=2282699 RepID=A0ABQ2QEV9_9GAMM|nr:hypothetical protein [Shewanella ulleungensis]MCL1148888.1 hypothetical protein [Shewanella ulleungensis]GGP74990.1 hypothetical protein GCM10009410_03650 [Shewanella ulleungensis]